MSMMLNGIKINVLHVEKIMNLLEVNFAPKVVMQIILFQNLINLFVNVCDTVLFLSYFWEDIEVDYYNKDIKYYQFQ